VQRSLVDEGMWRAVCAAALALFARGREVGAAAGLVLADTKYEFGVDGDGRLLLIDEMHTPDSSRYWVAETLAQRLAEGREPESLDKEPVRLALAAAGYRGDGTPPELDESVIAATSARYVSAYERITRSRFEPAVVPSAHDVMNSLSEVV
jgi:phosphoribosylaminoimidazole-succinocarboxamide synthase